VAKTQVVVGNRADSRLWRAPCRRVSRCSPRRRSPECSACQSPPRHIKGLLVSRFRSSPTFAASVPTRTSESQGTLEA
jgi:hypothetical protein